jgi:hypothetical protein
MFSGIHFISSSRIRCTVWTAHLFREPSLPLNHPRPIEKLSVGTTLANVVWKEGQSARRDEAEEAKRRKREVLVRGWETNDGRC